MPDRLPPHEKLDEKALEAAKLEVDQCRTDTMILAREHKAKYLYLDPYDEAERVVRAYLAALPVREPETERRKPTQSGFKGTSERDESPGLCDEEGCWLSFEHEGLHVPLPILWQEAGYAEGPWSKPLSVPAQGTEIWFSFFCSAPPSAA